MLPAPLRYLAAWIRYPQFADFIDAGLGIEARARRLKDYWARHLELSKDFQRRVINRGKRVGILGAGRLFDVDLEFLSRNFETIILSDADPGALAYWHRAARWLRNKVDFQFQIVDLTGVLGDWTRRLQADPTIETLQTLACSHILLPKAEVLVSLNLLSQISLYWRERALAVLRRRRNLIAGAEGELPAEWEAPLQSSMQLLEQHHLEALAQSGAGTVVLLSDRYWHFYERNRSSWQTENALRVTKVDLGQAYRLSDQDSWLWHLAPQGKEYRDYGVLHEVEARAFVIAQ